MITETPIPGLLLVELDIREDSRGWFKENWQREKMVAAGLPDINPVQQNVSYNANAYTTRGVHAEPWDKYVSVANGRVFGAWVDLREGPSFGTKFTAEIGPETAVFVPRGVGNGFQTLEDHTTYIYLVTEHWRPEAEYALLNPDEIKWPVSLNHEWLPVAVSAKDLNHPYLHDVKPVPPLKTLVLGADGQLGRALRAEYRDDPNVEFAGRAQFDLTNPYAFNGVDWTQYAAIINAAAYTAVDHAETPEGRRNAWNVNVSAIAELARVATEHRLTLVNVSSDYVFDGTEQCHYEDEPFSPLGVYGQTKAAGDAIVATVPNHYTVRTSWVIGDGKNFVRTMADRARAGASPLVVDDQFGRPTFADELAAGIRHLLETGAPYGTYNLTSSGEPVSWYQLAREVFTALGHDPNRVRPASTAEYAYRGQPYAPRPGNSTLSLRKLHTTVFYPEPWIKKLQEYLT